MSLALNSTTIVEGYMGLLNSLSPADKLDLISRLTDSVKTDLTSKASSFKNAFGAFESAASAEEMIDEIRSSRVFNRETESF